MNFAAIFAP